MSDTEATKAWEKQPWESVAGFNAFTVYYINQPPPRSVKVAYGSYQAAKGKAVSGNKLPGYWNRWAQGRDAQGVKIPGAMSWAERAAAYDKWLQDRIVEERVKRAARISVQWEDVTSTVFAKFRRVVEAYDPTIEGADLITLVSAMERLHRLSATVFGFQQPTVVEMGRIGDMAEKRKTAEGNLTPAARLQAVAEIFQRVAERQGGDLASGLPVVLEDGTGDLDSILSALADGREEEE